MSDFQCDQCSKKFKDLAGLKQHQTASHQSGSSGAMNACTFCNKSFPNEAAKQQHIGASHKDTKGASSTGSSLIGSFVSALFGGATASPPSECTSFQCKFCHKSYPSMEILQQHTTAKHTAENSTKLAPAPGHACGICNKLFSSPEAKQQHVSASHKETATNTSLSQAFQELTIRGGTGSQAANSCSLCNRTYPSPEALQQHVGDKHPNPTVSRQISSQVSQDKVPCMGCNRSYSTEDAMLQHASASHPQTLSPSDLAKLTKPKSMKPHRCMHCDDSFDTSVQLQQHVSQKHKDEEGNKPGSQSDEHVCTTCFASFSSKIAAEQHKQVKEGHVVKLSTRKLAVDCFLRAAQVDDDDRKKSVSLFRNIIQKIMDNVRAGKDGKIYSPDVARAGSTAVNVKIGKADEFDTNIPLNIPIKKLVTAGCVDYIYEDRVDVPEGQSIKVNLNISRKLDRCEPRMIPEGQAVVKVNERSTPRDLVHGEDLIPYLCQKDFYNKVRIAIFAENLPNVNLSREAHGPAITLTITPPGEHVISVDLTLSLVCDLKISQFGWPRPDTRRAFKPEKIDDCVKAPIHLVPKGGDTWAISFSKVEEALLIGIDAGNECRRHVMQILKRHLQICSSASRKGLEGISSYIVKQHILWSAEKYTTPGYWDRRRMDECTIDVIGDLIEVLRAGRLPLYFKPSLNILQHKRKDILNILVKYFEAERERLLKME